MSAQEFVLPKTIINIIIKLCLTFANLLSQLLKTMEIDRLWHISMIGITRPIDRF